MGTSNESSQLQTQLLQLKEQLAEEQLLRRQAEEAVEQAAANCSRLQKARDELAAALLAAERRAAEAEEEQLRAEATAAALEQALREQQLAAEAAGPAAPLSPSSEPPEPGARQGDSAMTADLEILLAELDQERQRSEELVRTLEAAEREAVAATEKLLRAQQRIKQLESGGKRGLFGGVRKSGSAAALAPDAGGPADGGGGEEGAAALQQRIAALKASRDKLIAAFDAQAAEVERLSGDNAALAQVGGVVARVGRHASAMHDVRLRAALELRAAGRLCLRAGCVAAEGRGGQVGGAGPGQPSPERAAEGPAGGERHVGPAARRRRCRCSGGGGAGGAGRRGHRGGGGRGELCCAGRAVSAL
jgi:hypothetical protein